MVGPLDVRHRGAESRDITLHGKTQDGPRDLTRLRLLFICHDSNASLLSLAYVADYYYTSIQDMNLDKRGAQLNPTI